MSYEKLLKDYEAFLEEVVPPVESYPDADDAWYDTSEAFFDEKELSERTINLVLGDAWADSFMDVCFVKWEETHESTEK